MTVLTVMICTRLGCVLYDHELPADVTYTQCVAMAPAILAQVELPPDASIMTWACAVGAPA